MRKSFAFGLVGLILGAVGTVVSVTAVVFSAIGLASAKKHIRRPRIR